MFTQFEERSRPTVTIQNVEPAALEAIVEYMYEPESLRITESNVQALLSGASLLQVAGVRAAAASFLAAALAPDNALGIRAFADLHACAELARHAATYIDVHFVEVLEGEEFLALAPDTLARLLDSDRIVVPSEEVILDAVIRWMQHDPENRRASLGELLEHVRLPLVSQEALVSRAHAEPLASAGLRVKDLVIEALSFHLMRGARRAEAAAACPRARPRAPLRAPQELLVVGGQAPKAIRDVEAYSLERARWRPAADLPTRRCRAGLARLDDHVFAIGGFNGTLRVRSVDVYDVVSDTWSAGPALTARRSTLGVAVIGTRIYAVGGFDGATGLSSAEVLDTRNPSAGWRPIAAMSTRRSSVGVAVLHGQLYAVGGYDGASRQCLHTVERYDPVTDTWSGVAAMSARRSGAGVGVLDDALYAVGGHDGPAVRRSVERYRAGEGWSPAPPMAHARRNAGVVAHNGKLYVVGGDDGAANLASVEVFDPATDSWSLLPAAMSVGRSYAGVCYDVPQAQPAPVQPPPIEPGYANVSVYGVAGVSGGSGARWRAVLARGEEPVYESAGCAGGVGGEGGGGAYWWWRVQACRRHARPHQPLELCTMPRVGRGRGAFAGAAGVGAGGPRGLELRDALSASCGSIADVAGGAGGAGAPCVLLLHAGGAAPAGAGAGVGGPRPSCSYHVLPESHRARRRPAACCDDGARDVAGPPPPPPPPTDPPAPAQANNRHSESDDSDAEGS
ncbi:kelch motif domain-containing protein [Phthorimaea operculella]|nr:kelch motif domain-containing protein [Phthorimaea operculella]